MKAADETPTEVDTADLMAGKAITCEEMAVELMAIELRLRQIARAAEVPATPVELADVISSLRSHSSSLRETGQQMGFMARVVDGDVPLATAFPSGDPWGAAARDSDRRDYGGPAIVPTFRQVIRLAQDGEHRPAEETTTYPEAMAGVGRGWESKYAAGRRRLERDREVAREVLVTSCETCHADNGEQCRTKKGWPADQPHVGRQREAEATVDARLGYLGDNPVAVAIPDAR